jgi:hypothetical protein
VRRFTLFLLLAGSLLVIAVPAAADDPVDPLDVCTDLANNAFAAEACGEELEDPGQPASPEPSIKDDGLPAWCRMRVEVVVFAVVDWMRIARAFAANPNPCADYYISVPAQVADRTRPRMASVYREIRDLSPRIHPIAEVTLGTERGWAKWVADGNGTWEEAGRLFRERMQLAGLRPELGETWLINEFDRTTRLDTTVRLPVEINSNPSVNRPYPRQAMRDLVRGLYEGRPGMSPLPGMAEIGINFSHQNLPDVPGYKEQMKGWLLDSAFWTDMHGRVRFLLRESYADTRRHSVPGTSRDERRRHLEDYVFHTLDLAEAGPDTVETARSFFRESYVPFLNAGYVAQGGDAFNFVTAHGNTQVDPTQMMHFVSEQVYATRHYAAAHPQGAPAGRLGFSWGPVNLNRIPSAAFEAQLDALAERIAVAIQFSYRQGGASPVGACAPPETEENWCQAERPGAAFTPVWENFDQW